MSNSQRIEDREHEDGQNKGHKHKLRIAFVVSRFPVLSQTFVINQATGLLDRGYEVDIFTEKLETDVKVHADVHRYDLLARTRVLPSVPVNYALRLLKGLWLIVRYGPRYPKQILQALNVSRLGKRSLSLWALFTIIPTLAVPTYDIIHAQFGDLGFRGLLLRDLMRLRGPKGSAPAKLIMMFRGFDISAKLKAEGNSLYSSLFQQADFFLTNCDFFRQRLVRLGCPKNRIRVHYSGLDCAKFVLTLRDYHPASGEPIRIAATGRLVEKKGFEYSIQAIAPLVKEYPNLTYDIMGDGPLKTPLSELIESLGLSQQVRLLGWCNEAEIIEVLERSHLFVAPSVTADDGNQDAPINVLKEAMALGLPVVSTYHGGIPELVKDGVSGLLVPERDADAIARALIALIEQPECWPDMGKAGRAYVEAHYDLNGLNDRLADLYQALMQESTSTGLKSAR